MPGLGVVHVILGGWLRCWGIPLHGYQRSSELLYVFGCLLEIVLSACR